MTSTLANINIPPGESEIKDGEDKNPRHVVARFSLYEHQYSKGETDMKVGEDKHLRHIGARFAPL